MARTLELCALPLLAGYARLSHLVHAPSEPIRRLLVTSTGGLGDGVLLNSLIYHLRRCDPPLEIGVMAQFGAKDVLESIGVRSHRYDRRANRLTGYWGLMNELRETRYDAALATDHTSLTTAALLCLARIPLRVGFKPRCDCPQDRLYTESITLDERESQWQSLVRLARTIQPILPRALEVVPLTITPEVDARVAKWWNEVVPSTARVVAMQLGAGVHSYKRWPVERFVETAKRLQSSRQDVVPLLIGRSEERSLIDQFVRQYPGRAIDGAVFDHVIETAALLRRCDLLVGNDSGVMHLAAAMGVPTVGLFGPASPIQWAPLGPRTTFVRGADLSCSPCIRNYRGETPARCTNPVIRECMLTITVDRVIAAVQRVAGSWLG
jgi:lipopolysaccharide heptosyltransferase II